jgi:hypothetical protein
MSIRSFEVRMRVNQGCISIGYRTGRQSIIFADEGVLRAIKQRNARWQMWQLWQLWQQWQRSL